MSELTPRAHQPVALKLSAGSDGHFRYKLPPSTLHPSVRMHGLIVLWLRRRVRPLHSNFNA